MAMVRKRGEKYELRIKHRFLPKGIFYSTFANEVDARNYGEQLEALLAQGHLPHDLVAQRVRVSSETLAKLMRDYQAAVPVSALDSAILDLLRLQIGAERADRVLKYQWAEDWVRSLKLEHHLAPGTIRKRVGAVARLLDWFLKREAKAGEQPIANPLRLLPKNYSTYNAHEGLLLESRDNVAPKKDVSRDRRLEPNEEARIVAALRGDKREGRERALELPDGAALMDLFLVLVNTGFCMSAARTTFENKSNDCLSDRPGLPRSEYGKRAMALALAMASRCACVRVAQQRVDYVICDSNNQVIAVVELDDQTHSRVKDQVRDARLLQAGIRTVRFQSKGKPGVDAVRAAILPVSAAAEVVPVAVPA